MRFSLLLILIFLFSFCSPEEKDSFVASYKDRYLTLQEIYNNIPPNILDTNIFIEQYTESWLKKKVLLDKAQMYISVDDIEIQRIVRGFEEDLIIHKYENQLIDNQFDTTVKKQQIEEYYAEYSEDFLLHQNIIKGRFVVIEKGSVNIKKIEQLLDGHNQQSMNQLNNLCNMYSNSNFLNDSVWVYFSEFVQRLFISEKETKKILSVKDKIHSFTDDNFRYIIYVRDYQIKGTNSPLPFVFNSIRELLQNKNKISFINTIEENLYVEAFSSGKIKIYNK